VGAARLADLLSGLSRLADYGFGLPVGSGIRSCALATRFARDLGLEDDDVRAAYYTALLHHVGCVGYAHETSRLFGDEIAANVAAGRVDPASLTDLFGTFLPTLTRGRPPLRRGWLALTSLPRLGRWGDEFTASACEVGRDTARRLDLPAPVQVGLLHVFDEWRSERRPEALEGEKIPIGARIARLAGVVVLFESVGGIEAATDAAHRRAGTVLDPNLVARLMPVVGDWLAELDATDARELVLAAEPAPYATAPDVRAVAEVFGDLADLKSPYLAGHSRAVAALAGAAADSLLPDGSRAELEVAGLLHDVGRVAVSNAVWDKPGELSPDEWEQMRLHPYHSERILAGSTEFARIAPVVGRHHERLDGSGYHRGAVAADLSMPARILAAADAYRTAVEPRPHRSALNPASAERRLLGGAHNGTLDADAVHAVIAAAGHRPPPRARSTRLSVREIEVLGLVAQGCSNAEIAARLVISRRTAEHHVQHIYTKIGVSSRAAATLYAVEHHLLEGNG
jgi:HD-GYP domain-containing protein (c-di-GMP phosphodiesterase class II)